MRPTALLFERYRAFKDYTRLNLAPLNVVIGKNGGGKSVISRLPLLLAGGLSSQAEDYLDLSAGEIDHATRYEDLIFQRSAQSFMLGSEIEGDGETLRFETRLRYVVERHSFGLESFQLWENDVSVFHVSLQLPEEIGTPDAVYLATFKGKDEGACPIETLGLFPIKLNDRPEATAYVAAARAKFEKAFFSPCYLGPFRSEKPAGRRVPRQGTKTLGPRGERTLDIIGDNALRGNGELARSLEAWFTGSMQGAKVVLHLGDTPQLRVFDPVRDVDVALDETGAGFAQVLPIAVQVLGRRMGLLDGSMSIVEQPELHLHPAVHGHVADLFINDLSQARTHNCHICETHSEQFITRLRRRIAEGKIPPSSVQIISVGHQAVADEPIEPIRIISIDENGNADSWPIGVFDEAFDDLVELRKAVVDKESSGDVA